MSGADEAYNNSDFIAQADAYPPRWKADSAAFRKRLLAEGRAELGIAYGDADRQAIDLFRPEGPVRGTVIFVHGGYWRAFARHDWSAFAAGALARGWAVAMPGYTLAPAARISHITRQIARAVRVVARLQNGPLILTGHSAGGHLAARMVCPDVALPAAVRERIERVVPISPLSDLRPLLDTAMNSDLRLDPAEAAAESPRLCPAPVVPVPLWVGGDERPAFLDQARWLAGAWPDARLVIEPGRHHFNVIDGLLDTDSPLMDALFGNQP